MFGIFIAIILMIVYGSLYPWNFEYRTLPANPLWILLHAWGGVRDRRFLADIIINIALYVPLGMSGFLALRKFRMVTPVLIALVVSASVEMVQLFTPSRVCSGFDLANNVVGSAVGVGLGLLFEKLAGPDVIEFGSIRRGHRGALALLFCRAGALFFPFYPEMHLVRLRADLARFAESPLFATIPFLSAAASWFVAGQLFEAAGFRNARPWLGISILILPVQFLIITRTPVPVDFIGAAAGFGLFLLFGSRTGHAGIVAWSFLALLLIRGLVPFHPGAAHPFIWVPFEGFLDMNWQTGIQVLLEKTFYYGSAIWLLRAAGIRLPVATGLVAMLLAAIECVQTRLPGRTAEITEPLLGVLIGIGLWALNPRRQSDVTLLPPVRR